MRDQIVCANGVKYNIDTRKKLVRLFVSGIEFNRPMLQIVKSMKDVRTIIFPSTIKEVSDRAFENTALVSAIVNEGSEKLGECRHQYFGIFCCSQIK